MDVRAAATLLDKFRELPDRIERSQTFMEIAGYPHYENVCSNFLAFFFDPEGPHGLGIFFLDALMDSISIADGEEGLGGNVSVEREVGTAAGNRIDILMKSDSHAVLIENKIFAAAINPFDNYAEYLDSLKNENGDAYENKIKILLTLYPSGKGAEHDFINVTHAGFVGAIRSRLGRHVSKADTRYLTLMLDFLNTLESLGEGTRMDQRFVSLLAEQSDEVEKFLIGIKQVRDEGRGKVQRLGELIDLKDYQDVRQIPWQPNPNHSLRHFLQHRVPIDKESYVVVEPVVSPSGWETQLFYRISRVVQNRLELERLLKKNEIPPENDPFIHHQRFAYDHEDLESIASVVQQELSRTTMIVQGIADKLSASEI